MYLTPPHWAAGSGGSVVGSVGDFTDFTGGSAISGVGGAGSGGGGSEWGVVHSSSTTESALHRAQLSVIENEMAELEAALAARAAGRVSVVI